MPRQSQTGASSTGRTFGVVVRRCRTEYGWTQAYLGNKCAPDPVDARTISRIERVASYRPHAATVKKLADAFGWPQGSEEYRLLVSTVNPDKISAAEFDQITQKLVTSIHKQKDNTSDNGPYEITRSIEGVSETIMHHLMSIDESSEIDNQIFIVGYDEVNSFDGNYKGKSSWIESLSNAMNRGWNIIHLLEYFSDHNMRMSLARNIHMLQGYSGKYMPLYIGRGVNRTVNHIRWNIPPYNIMVSSGKSAFIMFATNRHNAVDSVIKFDSGAIVDEIKKHCSRVRERSEIIVDAHQIGGESFDAEQLRASAYFTNRSVIMDGISEVIIPNAIFEQLLDEIITNNYTDNIDVDRIKAYSSARRRDFIEQITSAGNRLIFKDIYPKNAINRLVYDGIISLDSPIYRYGGRRLSPNERRECILNMLRLLGEHENYQIGLLDDNEQDIARNFFLVKSQKAVFIEGRINRNEYVGDAVRIIDELTVDSFELYFDHIWNSLQRHNKEKAKVMEFIRSKLEEI